MTPEDAVKTLKSAFPRKLSGEEFRGEQTLITKKEILKNLLRHCRDELTFDFLVDITSVDNMGSEPRFVLVYELYSYKHGIHLRIKTGLSEDDLTVDTISDLWPAANWHEREVYDMMGIAFNEHPDLRRILMWEGYPYYPLRKDFPLAGKTSDTPEVAFTNPAPLAGGPFVTRDGAKDTVHREPRSRA